jgi:hypothetical protein
MQLGKDSSEDTVVSYFRDAAQLRAARANEVHRDQSAPFDVDSGVARLGIIRFEEVISLLHREKTAQLTSTSLKTEQPENGSLLENLAVQTNHGGCSSTQEILYFRKLFSKHEAACGRK